MTRAATRRVMLGWVLVAGALATVTGLAQPRNFDDVQVQVLHVQENVFMLVGAGGNVTVQTGDDGVLVVDTQFEGMAEKNIAAVREIAGTRPIRYIVNTHAHPDHIGGNAQIAAAGAQVVAGNFAGQIAFRTGGGNPAFIMAHENALNRIIAPAEGEPPPFEAWPTDTFFTAAKDFFFNGEAVFLRHQPNAHTDGDILVHFRESDVVAAGDLYVNQGFPFIDIDNGGSLSGIVDAANTILEITVPADKQEGGTYVVPGHGRLSDEADVVEYRDMLTIIRDRLVAMIDDGMTLEQVLESNVVLDYEARYGSEGGFNPTSRFLTNAYNSLVN
jgi:glyoxylase-like metal-dependent hydrolase (beta-lactamase superfamily II)